MSFKFDFDIPGDEELENLDTIELTKKKSRRRSDSTSTGSLTPPASEYIHRTQLAPDGLEDKVSRLGIDGGFDNFTSTTENENDTSDEHEFDATTREVTLDELLDSLPPVLSYSPITIPLLSSSSTTDSDSNTYTNGSSKIVVPKPTKNIKLLRRDLFDARFQLANQDDDSDDEGSAFGNMIPRNQTPPKAFQMQNHLKDSSPSDLVKGIYEGGLKTWEASLDLISALDQQGYRADGTGTSIEGKRILEVGCGTAVPTLYLLERLFRRFLSEDAAETVPRQKEKTVVHLQDYNAEVIIYITFCNILLAFWNAKKHSSPSTVSVNTESSLPSSVKRSKEDMALSAGIEYTAEMDEEPDVDEIAITDEFVKSFEDFLVRHNIELKFFGGSWQTFNVDKSYYDVVLTSETVYDVANLPHLVQLLRSSAGAGAAASHSSSEDKATGDNLTLVACKRVYFGVGGGEVAFKCEAEKYAEEIKNIWSGGKGVERTVMQVVWKMEK